MQQAQHYEGQGLAQVAIREQASGTDTVTLEAPTTEETWDQFILGSLIFFMWDLR